jgi:cytochrome c peroxidase
MKSIRVVPLVLAMMVLGNTSLSQNKYIGVKGCRPCHFTEKQGKQVDIWQKSKHAEAYKTLTTAKANEIAKAKGLTKPAAESPECLECHATTADAKLVEKTFDMKEGVQCETCHGAGSGYKTIPIMKDRAKAIAAGMREFKDEAAIEAYCKTCHNPKSPTYKEFKFKESWDKIKHPVPKAQ